MSSITSRRSPRMWHPEWPALLGWVFVAVLVCLLYHWSHSGALPVLLGLLTLLAGVGSYLSTRRLPPWHFAWQQRQLWTELSSTSRAWLLLVRCVAPPALTGAAPAGILSWQQRVLYRHLAWLHALRLHRAGTTGPGRADPVLSFLEPAEAAQLRGADNLAAQLLAHQVAALRQLHQERHLTDVQYRALLGCLEKIKALPEAVPLSPPPPQPWGWVSWTWLPAALLTGLLASLLVETGVYSLWLAVPLTGLIYWGLSIMTSSAFPDKASGYDYFRGDRPAAVCRSIATELQKMPVVVPDPLPATS